MANIDKGRNKWENASQDELHDMRYKEDTKTGRRGKPQVEIYRPGSGPLRKTGQGEDDLLGADDNHKIKSSTENLHLSNAYDNMKYDSRRLSFSSSQEQLDKSFKPNSDRSDHINSVRNPRDLNKITERIGNLNISQNQSGNRSRRNSLDHSSSSDPKTLGGEAKRKLKKPEQAIYVPKPLAQAYAERDLSNKSPVDMNDRIVSNSTKEENWDNELQQRDRFSDATCDSWERDSVYGRRDSIRRNGKFENGRRVGQRPAPQCDWRAANRELRQTSEPPASRWGDRKPPSGRRGSKDRPHFEGGNLPPRFQKLRSAENGGTSYGSVAATYTHPQPQQEHATVPPCSSQQYWSHTLPHTKGRGRLRPEEVERFSRSLTPDRLTPSQVFYRTPSQENVAPLQPPTQPFASRGITQPPAWLERTNCTPPPPSPPVSAHAPSLGLPRFRQMNDHMTGSNSGWELSTANNTIPELNNRLHEQDHKITESSYRVSETNYTVPEASYKATESSYKSNDVNFKVPDPPKRITDTFYKVNDSSCRPDASYKTAESVYRITDSYKAGDTSHNSIEMNHSAPDSGYKVMESSQKMSEPNYRLSEVNHRVADPSYTVKEDNHRTTDPGYRISEANHRPVELNYKETDTSNHHNDLSLKMCEHNQVVDMNQRFLGSSLRESETKCEDKIGRIESTVTEPQSKSPSPKTLDWSEEVERVAPISSVFPQDWGDEVEQSEREAQQMGRSSSLTSLLHPDSSGGGGGSGATAHTSSSSRSRKKKRSRRSVSRDRLYNHDGLDDKNTFTTGSERNRVRGSSNERTRNRVPSGDRNRGRGHSNERNRNRGLSSERGRNRGLSPERKGGDMGRNRGPSWERNRNRGSSRDRKGGGDRDRNRHRGLSHERNKNRGPSTERGKSRCLSPDRTRNRGMSPGRGRIISPERNRNRGLSPEKARNSRGTSADRNRNRGHSSDRKGGGGSGRNRGGSGERKRNRSGERRGRRRGGRGVSRERRAAAAESKGAPSGSSAAVPPPSHPNVAGILILPPGEQTQPAGLVHHQQQSTVQQQTVGTYVVPQHRQLFDPSNPGKPIIVPRTNTRSARDTDVPLSPAGYPVGQGLPSPSVDYGYPSISPFSESPYCTEQLGNARPSWYGPYSASFRTARDPPLILDIERADLELQWIISSGSMLSKWNDIAYVRHFLQKSLKTLLETDIKFCQTENVEQHMWKITFYNIIELLRKKMLEDPDNKEKYKHLMLNIIEEGTAYFERLLLALEQTYKFSLDSFLASTSLSTKGLGFIGLALIASQKIFLYLGDLARYKEQINETSNFGKSRQYYIRAHQINPKNGRPYNQLAILAVYARRKLDAVYYYMRSLMASNPVQSARESLLSLFDENRKKFEQTERRRREEREQKQRERMKEKEGAGIRREVWIHPEGRRRRVHVTTSAGNSCGLVPDSEEEELAALSSVEVNKRFVISYLNVQGKLFTKVGMETFQESAVQMLREFRALLQHSPVPLNANRFLQLLALNMFAIENTQLKDSQLEPGYRPAVQESALVVSLEMFSLILEKCIDLLRDVDGAAGAGAGTVGGGASRLVSSEDLQILLPAVKVWCDWLLCHSAVWNPPPCCSDYRVGPGGDAWSRVATLVNMLERLRLPHVELVQNPCEGYEMVKLPEDATLSGFTPLMYNVPENYYTPNDTDMEMAQVVLRIQRIVFFGSEFLCGVDPPVLKLQKIDGETSEYVSVVDTLGSGTLLTGAQLTPDLRMESFSDDEDDEDGAAAATGDSDVSLNSVSQDMRNLLNRKEQLERDSYSQQQYRQYVQAILRDAVVLVEIEVKPHYLVPDTNCFIDYLPLLQKIAQTMSNLKHLYMLMIPLVVLQELEGLARGGPRGDLPAEHVARVAEAARTALSYIRSRPGGVRCVTSQGNVLVSAAFTDEQDSVQDKRNDDRILATTLSLCRNSDKEECKPGETRRLYREVVLLTEDRNLRVKALGLDVPVREVPDFVRWAGLG
ncbi:telomerase-binding protein EST1A [Schistocerca americana]|uniref:telomerase-binding protein EST1A n=1 Tax=Schistocerca americana TaxID=7009 RepID=UPI001F4F80A1|nr:telomerase-binding protein EST1A [Schistocerca americana]